MLLSLQLCPTLFNSMDCSPPGSFVHGILQERIMEWVAFPFFRGSSPCRDQTHVSYVSFTGRQVLYHWHHLGSPRTVFRINLFIFGCTGSLLLHTGLVASRGYSSQWVVGFSLQGFSCWGA